MSDRSMDEAQLQNLFRLVVLQANDVVLVTEAEGATDPGGPRVVYVNPAFTQMTGYSSDEIVGRTPRLMQSSHTDRSELDRIRTALTRWEPVRAELLNVRKDGTEFWVQISITPSADDSGWYSHWISIQRDITERKLRERELLAMLSSTSDLLLLVSGHGTVTAMSPAAGDFLEIAGSGAAGFPLDSVVHPDDRQAAEMLWADIAPVRTGPRAGGEVRLLHRDGTWHLMEISAADLPHSDSASTVLACVDVSDVRRTASALRTLNENLRGAFRDAPIGMAITATSGELLQVNTALVRLIGQSEQLLLQKSIEDLVHPADRSAVMRTRRPTNAGVAALRRHELRFIRDDGSIVWVLHSWSGVSEEHAGLTRFIDHFEDITDQKAFEFQLEHQALHDPLTGLANRALLIDRLGQALRGLERGADARRRENDGEQRCIAVIFLDVDRFKGVNDLVGHIAADALLVSLAERLRQSVRAGDTVARFGGDEFVVMCADGTPDQAAATATRLHAALRAPVTTADTDLRVTASVGVAFSCDATTTPEALLRDADAAMYAAKDLGRNRIEVFDEGLRSRIVTRLQMEADLRRAVDAGELRLNYQPIVHLARRAVVGMEALVRWQHPDRGFLPPAEFIPLAEEAGLILELGEWVLREAITTAARLRADPHRAGATMWVNVSVYQLQDPAFVGLIAQLLNEHRLSGSDLGLEITESVLLADQARNRQTLLDLRSLGVSLSIDDFGTGYSSLSYLARFPVNTVKIDRSFVAGLDDDATRRESYAVINAVVGLAHALELRVVAEGIETDTQAQALHGLGCNYGQGFLLGRPAPESG